MRAVFAVPPDRGFGVSDITIAGDPITSPSQIAEFIQIRVTGLAHGFGEHEQLPTGCRSEQALDAPRLLAAVSDELPSIDALIAAARAAGDEDVGASGSP